MRHPIGALLALVTLAGCAGSEMDRATRSDFMAVGPDRYAFTTKSAQSLDDSIRQAWLQRYVDENKICPTGYETQEMARVKVPTWLIPDEKRTTIITCKGVS